MQKRVKPVADTDRIGRIEGEARAVVLRVEHAQRERAGGEEESLELPHVGLFDGAALHHVRPLAAPLHPARMAPREFVEPLRQERELAMGVRPAGQAVDDVAVAQRPVGEGRVGEDDLAAALVGDEAERFLERILELDA